jgi:hypothetical protein
MILLAMSVVSTRLPQSDLSNKDQQTVTLLQWMKNYQNRTTFLCKGFIVVSEEYFAINHLASAVLRNIVETEHCTFFREYIVMFELSFFTIGMQ